MRETTPVTSKEQWKRWLLALAVVYGVDNRRVLDGYLEGKAGELYNCQSGRVTGKALKEVQNVHIERFEQDLRTGVAVYKGDLRGTAP